MTNPSVQKIPDVARLPATSALDDELDGLVTRRIVPGGAAAIVTTQGIAYRRVFGSRALAPRVEAATADTFWDLASLTKPLVTASLALALRQRGELGFDEEVAALVPELVAADLRTPTIGELLTHSAGLPSHVAFHVVAPGGLAEAARWLATHRTAPNGAVEYGCPAYLVLQLALERRTGRALREIAPEVLWPGRDDVAFPLPTDLRERAAPTERGNAFERRLAGDLAAHGTWRTEIIRGEVHDANAHALGGAAGNAGLFATLEGTCALVARFLAPGPLLSQRDLDELAAPQSPAVDGGELRTWGFQCARSRNSPAGEALSGRAFGHAGFTGTSVMVDPDRGAAYVLLTNRVHPEWTDHAFHADRKRFHAAAARWVELAKLAEDRDGTRDG